MNIHVTEIVEQVANAHRIDRSGADAGTDVAVERNHTPFVKLRPRCLHVLYDDALFFRKTTQRIHSNCFNCMFIALFFKHGVTGSCFRSAPVRRYKVRKRLMVAIPRPLYTLLANSQLFFRKSLQI